MKSEIKECTNKSDKPFPKLMISTSGNIILATKLENGEIIGTVIHSKENYILGQYSVRWSKLCFEDFEGKLILYND